MANKKKLPIRLLWADSLKGWLIILVVLGHALQFTLGSGKNSNHLWNLIYSFHMPVFMAVSGWLAYRPGKKTQQPWHLILRRAQQLLVPYFLWSVISSIIHRLCLWTALPDFILNPDRYFWFLWVLFFIHLFFILIEVACTRFHINHTVAIVLMSLVLVVIMVMTECRLYGYQFISYYFMFFSFGYFIHQYPALQTHRMVVILPCTVLWLLLAWWWRMHDLPSWMPAIHAIPSAVLLYSYRSITAMLATFVILNVSPILLDSPLSPNKFISSIGKWSLGIYTVHLSLISLLKRLLLTIIPPMPDWAFVLALFLTALGISLVVVWLVMCNKHTARWLMGKI